MSEKPVFVSSSSRPEFLRKESGTPFPNGQVFPSSLASGSSSGPASRDASVLARVKDQLRLGSPFSSSTNEDSDDELADGLSAKTHSEPLPYTTLRTGLCYDSRMRFHTELLPARDRSDYHPEDPRRILAIYKALCEAGLVEDKDYTILPMVANPLHRIPARWATKAEVCLVHEPAHFDFIKSTSNMSDDDLTRREKSFDSIYFHQLSYTAAQLSCGGAIETCIAVASGQVKNAIAVIRPPGHHAESDLPRGFCLFDNVSVAAKVVKQKFPDKYRKIMIVDWDVHHGNGIQQAFESDPNVLYISIHVHENGNFYPSGPYGDLYHCGKGAGVGKNINIPWPTKGMGDADYLFAFQHVIMPVGFDFDPDLVIIAAGFDAAAGDQLGGCFVTPACYAHMTHMLMSLAKGKLVVVLEGGYNLKSISRSALAVTKTLMGEPPERLAETAATKTGVSTVKQVIRQQSKFWRCLYPKDISMDTATLGAERIHDVIRAYQSKHMHENHRMIQLWIFREKISRSFENQVLATENYHQAIPLLVIFHDPPDMIGHPDPITSKLDLHNTWLADVLKHYHAWAIDHGFAIIDVNIPKYLTDVSDPYGDKDDEAQKITAATEELAIYLWDNYVEVNDSTKVFFLGVGDAYQAILHIMNTRNYEALEQIAGIVGFVGDNPIRPVTEAFITDLGKWYMRNSLIFVERDHSVWNRDLSRRPSRKFGTLRQSLKIGLNAMLMEHKPAVEEFLLGRAGIQLPIVPVPKVGGGERGVGMSMKEGVKLEEDGDTIMVASGIGGAA